MALLMATVEGGEYNIKDDFGAKGDNHTDDTSAVLDGLQKMKEGGHTLRFPAGLYRVGKLKISNTQGPVTLKFDEGAQLTQRVSDKTRKDEDDWHRDKHGRFAGSSGWFHAENCSHLTIDGMTMNGSGHWWWGQFPYKIGGGVNGGGDNPLPYTLTFSSSDDLTLKNIHIDLAPALHIKVGKGKRIRMNDIRLTTKPEASHNTDGILLADVEDACIDNAYIVNGDDCLKVLDKVKNVTFSNSYCQGGHGLTIGGGGHKLQIDNVRWVNVDLVSMSDGARFKFTPSTEGYVRNIVYQNLTMMDVSHPISIGSNYGSGDKRTKSNFEIGDITYTDIVAKYDKYDPRCYKGCGRMYSGHYFRCDALAECKKIHVSNVNIDMNLIAPKKKVYLGWECAHCGGTTDGKSDAGPGLEDFEHDSGHHPGGSSNCPAVHPEPGPSPTPVPPPSPTPTPEPGCSLVEQESSASCELGKTFGCDSGHVWISGGCRGKFTCDGNSVECNVKNTDHYECPCSGSTHISV